MSPHSTTLGCLVLSVAAPALLAGLDRPAVRHAEGQRIERAFSITTNWNLEEMTQVVAGEKQLPDPVKIDATSTRTLRVTDRVREVGNGRAVKLARTFDELAGSNSFELDAQVIQESYVYDVASDLESQTVVFEQSMDAEDRQAWSATWDENSDGEDALLEGLDQDLDLVAFLPPQSAEPGAEWKLPASVLASLFVPAGELQHMPVDAPDGPYQAAQGEDVMLGGLIALPSMRGEFEGEVRVAWVEGGEPGVATLELGFDVALRKDLAARLERTLEVSGVPGSGREDLRADVDWTLEGTGQILWDVERGGWRSLALTSRDEIRVAMSWLQDLGGPPIPIEVEAILEGSSRIEASAD